MFGGFSEFIVSISVIMAFSAAQKENINQGIGSCIMILNGVFITVLSYCFFRETVSKTQIIGIVTVAISVALVSIFGPEATPETAINAKLLREQEGLTAMFQVVMWGISGAIFLSFEIMTNKWLMIRRSVNGDITGMFFLLVEGTIGTICLIVTTASGQGLHELSTASIGMMAIAGVLAFSALIMVNYSISIGIAGVAISIFNVNPCIHVLISSIFLRQVITTGQVAGVVLAIFGACILSVGDMIIEKVKAKWAKDDADSLQINES